MAATRARQRLARPLLGAFSLLILNQNRSLLVGSGVRPIANFRPASDGES